MDRRYAFLLVLSGLAVGCATPSNTMYRTPSAAPAAASEPGQEVRPITLDPRVHQRITRTQPWVMGASAKHGVDEDLINAVIWVESRFDVRARSSAGARGLMQLMPATARSLAERMGRGRPAPYDPEFNIMAGTLYLGTMLERYSGDERLALAAYHAGAGNVDTWITDDDELPPNIQKYVDLVLDAKTRFIAMRQRRDQTPIVATIDPVVVPPHDVVPEPPVLPPDPPESVPDPVPVPVPEIAAEIAPATPPDPPTPFEDVTDPEPATAVTPPPEPTQPDPVPGQLPSVTELAPAI